MTLQQQEKQYSTEPTVLVIRHLAFEMLMLQSRWIIREPDARSWSHPSVSTNLVPSLAPGGFTNFLHFLNRKHSMHIQFVLKLEEYRYRRKRSRKPVSLRTPARHHSHHKWWYLHSAPAPVPNPIHLTLELPLYPTEWVKGRDSSQPPMLNWNDPTEG